MFSVMPGLAIISVMAGRDDEALLRADVPAIHVLLAVTKPGTWITGPSPVMTSEFISRQIEGCRARHERLGLAQKYLDGLDDILRDAATLIPMDGPSVILTGEYIPENFLLSCENDNWQLTGLIDFGDVMTGWSEYDLLGPSAFMSAGMPRRVENLFRGFGYSRADVNFALKRRLMALLLLHRFSDPNRHICIEGWQQKAGDLFELQELLWPI